MGYEATRVKYFKTRKDAKRYALKLVEELKEIAKVSDDFEYVQIENENGEIVDFWRAEKGEVIQDC